MKSITELFKIGPGPSSSHTFGPKTACELFLKEYPTADLIEITLYGSLSLTGKGHLTDMICIKTCHPIPCVVHFSSETCSTHPNTMDLFAYENKKLLGTWRVYSVGGGAIQIEGQPVELSKDVYKEKSFDEIRAFCAEKRIGLDQYVDQYEDIDDHMNKVLDQMLQTIENGISTRGTLPGKLQLKRIAADLYRRGKHEYSQFKKEKLLLMSYAYAAAEENASGGMTVTSPTMGASGVMPALVRYYYVDKMFERAKIIRALKIAGIIGNLFKHNATISGAQGGCQAEIGVACSMGSAFVAYMENLNDDLIAYAAEVGIEHFLGLTCDPVGGYVMIPCIERNAIATLRAMDSSLLAQEVGYIKPNKVSLDMIIHTMNYTGKKIAVELKETSLGGLASVVPLD